MSCLLYQIQYGQREPRKSQKIRLIKKMAGVEFKVTRDEESKTVILSCLGSGYRNYSKASTQFEMVSAFECDVPIASSYVAPASCYIHCCAEIRPPFALASLTSKQWLAGREETLYIYSIRLGFFIKLSSSLFTYHSLHMYRQAASQASARVHMPQKQLQQPSHVVLPRMMRQ